jgi:UDPglucose--hexose-1-phosphate uridylyltransferase
MDLIQDFLNLGPDTPQPVIQEKLAAIHSEHDLTAVMDCLYKWELKAGYITREKLEDNERLSFHDPDLDIDFRIQINIARSKYSPKPVENKDLPRLHCLICKENVGRPDKENLRIYKYSIDGKKRDYFIQLTPFPLFPHHFVLILSEPLPMEVSRASVTDMFDFLNDAPGYTVCSNSDVEWAGSSILEHLHYQVFKDLELPVMQAGSRRGFDLEVRGCNINLLNYPMATLKVRGRDRARVIDVVSCIIETWKNKEPGKNTAKLILVRNREEFNFYIFFRNPEHRTPEDLIRIKSEGVGIIEAAGEGIYPVPSGDGAEDIWKEIRENGLEVVKWIIQGNNPIKENELHRIKDIYQEISTKL